MIIDEVLSVGDAKFQKKCLGKMDEATNKRDRTIIFVSHNMDAIQDLCTRCVLLDQGVIKMVGDTSQVIEKYLNYSREDDKTCLNHVQGENNIIVDGVQLTDYNDKKKNEFYINEKFKINISTKILNDNLPFKKVNFFILISDNRGRIVVSSFQKDNKDNNYFNVGEIENIFIDIECNLFLPGNYYVSVGVFDEYNNFEDWVENAVKLSIKRKFYDGRRFDNRLGIITQEFNFRKS